MDQSGEKARHKSKSPRVISPSPDLRQRIQASLEQLPELPNPNPTTSAWQEPPHPRVATAQSLTLPAHVDIAIIGSGITGCGTAYALLHDDSPAASKLHISVLEARGAVSGATGRNGGHLVSDADSLFGRIMNDHGLEQAKRVLHFSEANMSRLKTLVSSLGHADREASEFRSVIASVGFTNSEMFEKMKSDIDVIRELVPERDLDFKVISKETAEKNYRYRDIVGAIEQHGSGALSPYRLFTAVFNLLLDKFQDRFTLETNTPVTSIDYSQDDEYPYMLQTPRGLLRTKQVVHCTNGFSAYLTPHLCGKLWPVRATMSVQEAGPLFPQLGSEISWTPLSPGSSNAETGVFSTGLYYAQQNPKTGHIWIGGDVQNISEMVATSDDSKISPTSKANLESILPRVLSESEPAHPIRVWSGIMGFTSDGMPYVGKLTTKMTGRQGHGEFIAAGFNGHGMDKAWLSGEAVASLILHEKTTAGFPDIYLLNEERFYKASSEQSANAFLSLF